VTTEGDRAPIGPFLDGLDVSVDLHADDRITDVLVICKVTNMTSGRTAVGVYHNDLDWIMQRGLVAAAEHILTAATSEPDDDGGHDH
jgi:hypothetical protein